LSGFQRTSALAAVGALGLAVGLPQPAKGWALLALAAAYFLISAVGVFAVRMNYYAQAVCSGKTGGKRIALTFDDGPDGEVTPVLLDVLKAHGAHATFFCVGQNAQAHPEVLRRILGEGHTLGNHSYSHHWWTNFLTKKPLVAEINRAQGVFTQWTGIAPRFYRSPMGLANPHLSPALRETGLQLVGWNVRPFDRGASARKIISRVTGKAGDGSIVLLHDRGPASGHLVEAVTGILERLQTRGYRFVSLDELFRD
jgi:peptidoglycan/xylan/chitin deacetylase (PgdA/CDA1 family)